MKVKFQVYSTNFVGEIEGKKNSWTCYFIGLNKYPNNFVLKKSITSCLNQIKQIKN